jgi:hypothetical protein
MPKHEISYTFTTNITTYKEVTYNSTFEVLKFITGRPDRMLSSTLMEIKLYKSDTDNQRYGFNC